MTDYDPEWNRLRGRIHELEQAGGDPAEIAAVVEQLHDRYLDLARGGTTAGGLPYPYPTDPVAEGADAIRALAEALSAPAVGTPTVVAGYDFSVDPTTRVIRDAAGWVHAYVAISRTAGIPASLIGYMPPGFTPATDQRWFTGMLLVAGGPTLAIAQIATNGGITVVLPSGATAGPQKFVFSAHYPAAG